MGIRCTWAWGTSRPITDTPMRAAGHHGLIFRATSREKGRIPCQQVLFQVEEVVHLDQGSLKVCVPPAAG